MQNEYLGQTIPKLGFGLMRLPMHGDEVDLEQTITMVDHFISNGFTYFDTAYPYIGGKSEVAIKEALVKRYPREAYQLADKLPVWLVKSHEDCEPLFQTQLERTGAGYFDFYLLHALDKDRTEELEKHRVWDFAEELKAKGLVKHYGFSFHDTADVLDDILTKHPEAEFVQLQINYADWDNNSVQSKLCYEVARKHNKPVIIMEPVKGGALAAMSPEIQSMLKTAQPDLSIASWAIRYAASLDGVITVLSGMSTMEQMLDNTSFMTEFKPLDDSEKNLLSKVVDELAKVPQIPCTKCKYCVDDCPQKINIPGVFSAYNSYKTYQDLNGSKGQYKWVTGNGGKASDCIACGSCEGQCPQHIGIIETLKEVAGVLE